MYVITGGGGYTLEAVGSLPQCALSVSAFNYLRVDVAGPALTFRAVGLDGAVIDSVTLNPPPAIAPGGVLNGDNFSSVVAAGSLVSVFGRNLATRPETYSTSPLPSQMGGISVSVNGRPAPLLYVSPTQINLRMPYGISGRVTLQVTTPNGSTAAAVTVDPASPLRPRTAVAG
jgi:hypothetical protein